MNRSLGYFLLGLLGLVAAIWITLVAALRPTPWEIAARRVAAQFAAGDVILITPEWHSFEAEAFAPLPAVATASVPVDLDRFDRAFLVEDTEALGGRGNLPAHLAANGVLLWSETLGPLRLSLFQLPPRAVEVLDLTAALPTATVRVVPDTGDPVDCPWTGDRFSCPQGDWVYVGPVVQQMDSEPVRCIWSHPVEAAELVVTFPAIREATAIEGWFGLSDYALSIPDGQRAEIEVRAGPEHREFNVHRQRGRRPLSFDLPANWDGPIEVAISARSAGVRHLCWNLQAVRRPREERG